jgi:hypothetical protein
MRRSQRKDRDAQQDADKRDRPNQLKRGPIEAAMTGLRRPSLTGQYNTEESKDYHPHATIPLMLRDH